jgi:hypothetical protein
MITTSAETARAVVSSLAKGFRFYFTTRRALLTRSSGINLNEQLTSVLSFVSQLLVERGPGGVTNVPGKMTVLDHFPGAQFLRNDEIVVIDILSR